MKAKIEKLKALLGPIFKKSKEIGAAIYKSLNDSIAAAPPELRKRAKQVLMGAAGLFVLISVYKSISYHLELRARARELAAGPFVRVAKVAQSAGDHVLNIVGETRPYQSVTLYAKVSGYLKTVQVDKGDVVPQGKVLAVIESPETDQAYEAALADAKNKRAIAARMTTLRAKALVSQQEYEQAQSDADVSSARLHSQEVEKGYEILRAPFSGTVTARFADPGSLVQNATASQASALPVVTVSQIRRLRVDIFLDQRDAPFVEKDEPVEITVPERPGLKIQGVVSRLSDELDPRTKMLLTEIDIPNEDRILVAGSFVQVSLRIKSPPYLEVPVEALALKNGKSFLTIVSSEQLINFKPVEIADNDGKVLRLISGVKEGEMVALNVGNAIPEGGKVRPIIEDQAPATKAPSPAAEVAPTGALPQPLPVPAVSNALPPPILPGAKQP